MDDLDDLLDEVENDLLKAEISSQKGLKTVVEHSNRHKTARVNKKKAEGKAEDIDDAIDSILDQRDDIHDCMKLPSKKPAAGKSENSNMANDSSGKCYPVYLGGATAEKGKSAHTNKKACNNIRCTSCDFKVLTFHNCQWHDNADYLFFRNNMPDKTKLQPQLRKEVGSNAYCCQCSWKTVKDLTSVAQFKDLKWVCGKHS